MKIPFTDQVLRKQKKNYLSLDFGMHVMYFVKFLNTVYKIM